VFEDGRLGKAEALGTSILQGRSMKKDPGFDFESLRTRNLLFAVFPN
jgi:hypothetical protein